jgi:flagellin
LAKGSSARVTVTVSIGASTIAAAINKMADTLGVTAQVTNGGKLKLYNPDGGNIKITERAGNKAAGTVQHTTTKTAGKYYGYTYHNVFAGTNGFFINQALKNGANLIATAGFTGGANDAFVNTIGTRKNINTPARLTNGKVTIIRGTVTITGPSAFKFTDYWENGEGTNTDPNLKFSQVITSGGALVKQGKVDFTRTINKSTNNNLTTNAGRTADGIVYNFSAANQQMFLNTTNILTASAAQKAIDRIDQAINDLNRFRATLGAVQNRFESTINNLNNYVQKLTDARSRIVDADIAKEAAELTMNNIKRQAASAILTQANQNPSLALQLLQGL